MTRMLLAALALACCALSLIHPGFALALLVIALRYPLPIAGPMALGLGAAAALVVGGACSPAIAAEAVPTTTLVLPWGDWLVALAHATVEIMLPIVIPLVAAYAIAAIRKVYPWVALSDVRIVVDATLRQIERRAEGQAEENRE